MPESKIEATHRLRTVIRCLPLFMLCLCLSAGGRMVDAAEGKRLPAVPSAERSAGGHLPELANDDNEATLWVANLKTSPENNTVWFQLDLRGIKSVARLHWLAAEGDPHPASSPSLYRVLVSKDGSKWTPVVNDSAPPPQHYQEGQDLEAPTATCCAGSGAEREHSFEC